MGWASSHSVSPVVVSFSPAAPTMSPARTSGILSFLFACMRKMRATRSLFPLVELYTSWSARRTPE